MDGSMPDAYGEAFTKKMEAQARFASAFPLETERLVIRELTRDDIQAIHAIATHEDFSYYYFDKTLDTTQAFVAEAMEAQLAHNRGELRKSFMMIACSKQTNEVVGHVTLDIMDKAPDDYDLAYFISPLYQGCGYAKEAAKAMARQAFDMLGTARLVATVHPDNAPSKRILSGLGFEETDIEASVESHSDDSRRIFLCLQRDRHASLTNG